ncbi:hypothetical protein PHET_11225 [Paragonimus heterotremus]|uniref:Uncharacterized protein n=1 Tax=Paragonimus heterotremus TaxID=100268 RepID=A0A8J4SQF9_9TREM|nr:hypothetical protein PHET_11225 [Paragonimus heterotremus]
MSIRYAGWEPPSTTRRRTFFGLRLDYLTAKFCGNFGFIVGAVNHPCGCALGSSLCDFVSFKVSPSQGS